MEIFICMVGTLSDKQADVVIATIGFISAAFVAGIGLFGSVLTFVLNKRSGRKIELRKIKEMQYIEFLGSDIVNIGLHFILKNIRPYAASCSEA